MMFELFYLKPNQDRDRNNDFNIKWTIEGILNYYLDLK